MDKVSEVKEFYNKYPYPDDRIKSLQEINIHQWVLNLLDKYELSMSNVADIGCGTGEIGLLISQNAKSYDGYDLSKASIGKAKALFKRFKVKNAHFRYVNITYHNNIRKKYDVVFCIGVFHHIDKDKQDYAMANIKKMLKPNGKLVISIYSKYASFTKSDTEHMTNISRIKDMIAHPYRIAYGKNEFKKIMENYGFKVTKIWRDMPDFIRYLTGRGRMITYLCEKR